MVFEDEEAQASKILKIIVTVTNTYRAWCQAP